MNNIKNKLPSIYNQDNFFSSVTVVVMSETLTSAGLDTFNKHQNIIQFGNNTVAMAVYVQLPYIKTSLALANNFSVTVECDMIAISINEYCGLIIR